MASLYELTGQYKYLEVAMLCNPDDDELAEEFAKISDDIETKAENYGKIIRNLETEEKAIAEEEQRLASRRKGIHNSIDRMKANLTESMKETGKLKFKTDLFSFNIANNGGKLPLVVDVTVDELPEDLVKVTRDVDKDALRTYIEETGDLSYGHFGDRGESLRIR